jgi:hypothetical protein
MSIQQLSALLKAQPQVTIHDFCKTWIPKLYNVHPGEYGYKKACVTELVRLFKGAVKPATVSRTWKWGEDENEYPDYVDPLLDLAHQRYSVLEAMGELRRYS